MCPGGYVVNASSEPGHLAVNGMSYSGRSGENANSAVIVTVHPEDYPGEVPLAGVAFQRALEEAAWKAGEGRIPVQRFQDYCRNQPSKGPGEICPQMKGDYAWTNIRPVFPAVIGDSIEEAMVSFDRKIPGFAGADVVLAGVESRTSSPVRILPGQSPSGIHSRRCLSLRGGSRIRRRDHIRRHGRAEGGGSHRTKL